jgi:hypothetical protein
MQKFLFSLGLVLFFSSITFSQSLQLTPTSFYSQIVQLAEQDTLNGLTIFSYNGKSFNTDCSGFVSYIYYKVGIDLSKYNYRNLPDLSFGIFQGLEKTGLTYREKDVSQIGDLVFFDNTYDANQNSLWDDFCSHVGIVTQIDENHTITFIHYSSKGLAKAYLNLYYPNDYAISENGKLLFLNSYLRKQYEGEEDHPDIDYYSAHLFNCFAHIPYESEAGND